MSKSNRYPAPAMPPLRTAVQNAKDTAARSRQFHRDWMTESYRIYCRVNSNPAELAELKAIVTENGAPTGTRTHAALLVMKATTPQPSDSKADSARAAVLRAAEKKMIAPEGFEAWYAESGGLGAVRHARNGAATVSRRDAVERAADDLLARTPMATVKANPVGDDADAKLLVGVFRPGRRGGSYELLRLVGDKRLTEAVLFHLGKTGADEPEQDEEAGVGMAAE